MSEEIPEDVWDALNVLEAYATLVRHERLYQLIDEAGDVIEAISNGEVGE